MSAWQYCEGCGDRLEKPTFEDLTDGNEYERTCPSCGIRQSNLMTPESWIGMLAHEIVVLKAKRMQG